MAKLIGNYTVPGQSAKQETEAPATKEATVDEFERKAMARLGGSIAFVMKGKNVVWNGGAKKERAE
nr:hypothetical protein [Nitrospirota bacterium]